MFLLLYDLYLPPNRMHMPVWVSCWIPEWWQSPSHCNDEEACWMLKPMYQGLITMHGSLCPQRQEICSVWFQMRLDTGLATIVLSELGGRGWSEVVLFIHSGQLDQFSYFQFRQRMHMQRVFLAHPCPSNRPSLPSILLLSLVSGMLSPPSFSRMLLFLAAVMLRRGAIPRSGAYCKPSISLIRK